MLGTLFGRYVIVKGITLPVLFSAKRLHFADAFTLAGGAVEKDQGPDGRNLLYTIHDPYGSRV